GDKEQRKDDEPSSAPGKKSDHRRPRVMPPAGRNMPRVEVTVNCPVYDSFRVRQVAGMFDLPLGETASEHFSAEVPDLSEPWQIGLIVGPSGGGKTNVARHTFGDAMYSGAEWPTDRAVID